ncbi:SLC13 family permease [Fulvivirga sediminis]|uniref:SLC13 family permease n=1 Tax=Fulvivirga sediminis TaxID=2803949 RepID=A0A937F7D2_9BACT|nr:SLC13 family permease [Fulvivirga sediminis]MBL3655624.1 SLC13 family permease [Fulvivirga sediminis]
MNLIAEAFQPYFVIAVILLLFVSIYLELVKPSVSFLFAIIIFIIFGIITPSQVLDGFSNQSIASVVLLILITAGVRSNFNVEIFLNKIFGRAKTYRGFLFSMMSKVALLSSFVNNTPVVVLLTPYVFNWGKQRGISPSKLLIPLSYSTIIGGMITVIGTSTTLVLNGFLLEHGIGGLDTNSLFIVGSTVAVCCIGFLALFSKKLLPNHTDFIEKFESNKRQYLIEKRLSENSPLIGKSISEGGLRNLNGVYLVEIVRGEKLISPVTPKEIIQPNDVLIFAGNTDNIVDLTLTDIGVHLPEKLSPQSNGKVKVVEGVVSANSSLIGKTIKSSNFRERYDAAVIAVHRNGEKLSGKIGRMSIKAGDVLLMYVGADFNDRVDLYKDLYVITGETKEIGTDQKQNYKIIILLTIVAALAISRAFSLFVSLLIIFTVMIGMRLISMKNIKRDLDVNLVSILVLSLALGEAIINTGTGEFAAKYAINLLEPYGPIALMAGIMLITTLLTSFITNVGAVSIAFPLTLAICSDLGISGDPFYLALAFSASAAFLTPVGYQTNLIIYGPGGYNFKDFLKIGLPITLIYLGIALSVIILLYKDILIR